MLLSPSCPRISRQGYLIRSVCLALCGASGEEEICSLPSKTSSLTVGGDKRKNHKSTEKSSVVPMLFRRRHKLFCLMLKAPVTRTLLTSPALSSAKCG